MPPTLLEKPNLSFMEQDLYQSFWELSSSRDIQWNIPPISFMEIEAYTRLKKMLSQESIERLVRMVRLLDEEYLKLVRKKAPPPETGSDKGNGSR